MRQKNNLTSEFVTLHRSQIKIPLQLYSCVDGGKTTDITKAKLNEYGEPITIGYSKDSYDIKQSPAPLSFSPSNPLNRIRAFEARAKMNELSSMPTDYSDKFEAIQYVNNVSSAFTKAYTLKSTNNNNNEHE